MSDDFIHLLQDKSPGEIRVRVFEKGRQWFGKHPQEAQTIKSNLKAFEISPDNGLIDKIQDHILLHYYEKLLPLCLTPQHLHAYLSQRVNIPGNIGRLRAAFEQKQGIVLAVCHFGAVECIGLSLAAHGLPLTSVQRFSTPHLSSAARRRSQELAASGLFANIDFIEIGSTRSAAALDMAAVLRRGGILMAVFDERTQYSVPVSLLKNQVWGGAGLDRLVRFAKADAAVWTAFAIRNLDETYDMRLFEHSGNDPRLVNSMYDNFESLLGEHCAQWYFLHEEIPFVT